MMVLCVPPIRCFQGLDIQPLSHCPGKVMIRCSRKSKWAWALEETSLGWEREEAGWMFGQTAHCLAGTRELVVGTPEQGLGLMGSHKRDSPISFGPGPLFLQEPPHGGAAPCLPSAV